MSGLAKVLLLAATLCCVAARAEEERNVWPFWVQQMDTAGQTGPTTSVIGPLFFSQPVPSLDFDGATRAKGFRPLYVETTDPTGQTVNAFTLYPMFSYRRTTDGYRWTVFELINHYKTQDAPTAPPQRAFDLWPFYFSRDTGSADTSYHAVFPLFGTIKNRFGEDRLSWVLFPLYGRFEKNNVTTTTAPWPFIKVLSGEGNHGFELWPLFGYRAKEATYREQFYLWPLIYKSEQQLWAAQPDVSAGFLPFYATTRTADFHSETFLWPFFGYSDRVAPERYHENDYFWPLFVQGRGDVRYVNRWGPFYTHSIVKGTDKTWVMWPLWRNLTWVDGPLRQTKRQFFYFLYNETVQQSARNPAVPAARKAHYWPLFSYWDNGAGQRQIQALSPLDVFFPDNNGIRLTYDPIFALYRYNRTAPGHTRQSLLWNFITFRREPTHEELHIGPLYSAEADLRGKRYTLGNGVVAWERSPAGHWRISFFDFKRREPDRPANPSHP